ncbi:MAG TPA: NAD-dependent epimerase/dehydratase family protein [Acidobacteriota bacterium]|nr:NAD-dependent epimerase/dehydratase family protein [Acidobacteriota bacterium]
MKVLVTGGAGFIGSHLCEGLLREGYQVRVLDDLSVGKLENVPAECEFIQGSILDPNIVEQAVNGVTHILHDAARVTIRGSVDKFYEDAETNLMGTLQLLKIASKQKVQRFIYASSMAVYADSEEPVPISENYSQLPASPYGIAKLAAERYVLLTSADFGMQPVVLRYFNTFGIRQTYTPYVGVITIFITRLLNKQNLTIFGDGEQRRDFVHVSDIVQANLLALKNDSAVGETFNVGTGIGTSVNELAQLLTSTLYSGAHVTHEAARTEELRYSIADVSKAKSLMGYSPQTNFAAQIPEVVEFIRKNL